MACTASYHTHTAHTAQHTQHTASYDPEVQPVGAWLASIAGCLVARWRALLRPTPPQYDIRFQLRANRQPHDDGVRRGGAIPRTRRTCHAVLACASARACLQRLAPSRSDSLCTCPRPAARVRPHPVASPPTPQQQPSTLYPSCRPYVPLRATPLPRRARAIAPAPPAQLAAASRPARPRPRAPSWTPRVLRVWWGWAAALPCLVL
jgi:hypothetical protein